MSKIQAVICPQCGSPNLTSLGDDKFQCESCRANYFIDKEKLEVHVRHSFEPPKPAAPKSSDKSSLKKVFGIILACFALLFIVTLGLNSILFNKKSVSKSAFGAAENNDQSADKVVIALSGNKPKMFVLFKNFKRNDKYELSDGKILLRVYEPETKELVKEIEVVPSMEQAGFGSDYSLDNQLSVLGNTIWYVAAKSKIYGIDPNSFEVKQTNENITAQFSELASGIGSVESISYEKGFKIQNNNGASYFYFPLENKLYTEAEYKKAKDGLKGKDLVKRFTFEKIEGSGALEKMKKLYEIKRFESQTGPGQSCVECIYFDLENVKKGAPSPPDSEIKEVKEFTPERSYFDGQYLYNDENEVLISFKRTANEKDASVIQCLDANGNTKWTVEPKSLSSKSNADYSQYTGRVFKDNGTYYLTDIYKAAAIDETGKVLWSYDVLNRNDWK